MSGSVRVLSTHASYRCANSGACCTSNWPIPVEADRLAHMQAALAGGQLAARDGIAEPLLFLPGAPRDTPALLAAADHRCAFYDGRPGHRSCRVHHTLGHDALPLACRQFPRVVVHDPRGASVTLSHYCPTAAAMLDVNVRVDILADAPAFPRTGEYVGLDATDALPPLLRAGVLMDWESWWECERLGVELIGNSADSPGQTLARLADAIAQAQSWSPDAADSLVGHVRRSFALAMPAPHRLHAHDELLERLDARTPAGLSAPLHSSASSSVPARVANRFLAAHAFANWAVHGRGGLDDWLRSIETAHALLAAGAGVRGADLRLRHLADAD